MNQESEDASEHLGETTPVSNEQYVESFQEMVRSMRSMLPEGYELVVSIEGVEPDPEFPYRKIKHTIVLDDVQKVTEAPENPAWRRFHLAEAGVALVSVGAIIAARHFIRQRRSST